MSRRGRFGRTGGNRLGSNTTAIPLSRSVWTPPPWRRRCVGWGDRKSTRLNSSHGYISYAVFCLKKKKNKTAIATRPTTSTLPDPLPLTPPFERFLMTSALPSVDVYAEATRDNLRHAV